MKKDKESKKIKITLPKLSGSGRFGLSSNMNRDWKIILISMFSLAVLIVLISAYIFYGIHKGDLFRGIDEDTVISKELDVNALKSASGTIEDLRDDFINALFESPKTYDPSL